MHRQNDSWYITLSNASIMMSMTWILQATITFYFFNCLSTEIGRAVNVHRSPFISFAKLSMDANNQANFHIQSITNLILYTGKHSSPFYVRPFRCCYCLWTNLILSDFDTIFKNLFNCVWANSKRVKLFTSCEERK